MPSKVHEYNEPEAKFYKLIDILVRQNKKIIEAIESGKKVNDKILRYSKRAVNKMLISKREAGVINKQKNKTTPVPVTGEMSKLFIDSFITSPVHFTKEPVTKKIRKSWDTPINPFAGKIDR